MDITDMDTEMVDTIVAQFFMVDITYVGDIVTDNLTRIQNRTFFKALFFYPLITKFTILPGT